MPSQAMVAKKMCTSTELQLKATLNYTDGKLNIYTYVKIVF